MIKLPLNEPSHPHSLRKELELAVRFAQKAGEIVRDIRKKGYQTWEKGGNGHNPVTEADHAASDYISSALSDAFPDDIVISEESPIPASSLSNKRIWFIDPIDGTKEFIQGTNEWSVMIGLSIKGRPVVGVVYQPDTAQLYYAVKGSGSYSSDNKQIKRNTVRQVSKISDAVLIQSRSHRSPKADMIAKHFDIKKTLQHGSIGLKLGLIAKGEADLYMNFSCHCHLWDVCGPEIILEEAGGKIITALAYPFNYHTKTTLINQSFLAASTKLSDELSTYLT